MRKVDRALVGAPQSLTDANGAGAAELLAVRAHFAGGATTPVKFSAYKGDDVLAALEELFLGKCAYCESSMAAVAPADVEHFRPKGRVEECDGHRGYWWLAARWDNLLLSCIHCNRRRRHTIFRVGASLAENLSSKKVVSGKGDSFPILGPAYAQLEADSIDAEMPALIDPTRTDPGAHLVWFDKDDMSLIGPQVNGGAEDVWGLATMSAFGLNRQGLVEQRTALLLRVKKEVVDVEDLLDIAIRAAEATAEQLLGKAWEMLESLYALADPHQPYATMVRDLMESELARLEAKFANLPQEVNA